MIKAQGLQLYTQSRNSAGERVRIALHLKGLQYEYIPVSAMTSEEYRSANPQGLMPALRVENSVFAAILEYLEEHIPTRRCFRPIQLQGRKLARSPSLYPLIHNAIIASAAFQPLSESTCPLVKH